MQKRRSEWEFIGFFQCGSILGDGIGKLFPDIRRDFFSDGWDKFRPKCQHGCKLQTVLADIDVQFFQTDGIGRAAYLFG